MRYAICMASSSGHEWLDHCVDKFGLGQYFGKNLFSATDVPNGKPAPDIFLYAAGRMGFSPSACLVLEDSPSGIMGALGRQPSVFSAAATSSTGTPSNFAQPVPVTSLTTLLRWHSSSLVYGD